MMRTLTLAASMLFVASQLPSQIGSYQEFGTGCRGSNSLTPILFNNSVPTIGRSLGLTVARGLAQSTVALQVGGSDRRWAGLNLPLDLTPFGAPTCNVLASWDVLASRQVSDSTGFSRFRLPIPNQAALVGQRFFTQALLSDRRANNLGLTVSSGGRAEIGATPGIELASFGPQGGNAGTRVRVRGNFGPFRNPDDFCFRVTDDRGNTGFIRPVALRPVGGGLQELEGQLRACANVGPAPLVVFGGSGQTIQLGRSRRLGPPRDAWAWRGNNMPRNAARTPGNFQAGQCLMPCETGSVSSTGNCIVIRLPNLACPGGGGYPNDTKITMDAHWNMNIGAGIEHFDFFLWDVPVIAPVGFPLSCATVTADLTVPAGGGFSAGAVRAIIDANYPGQFAVTAVATGTCGEIRICPLNPTWTLTDSPGGNVKVCCP